MAPENDRRAALKARHRQAIIDATRDLVEERGGPDFGVDEIAARADVARRTVFNHFPTLDDVFIAVCQEVMMGLSDSFIADLAGVPAGSGGRDAMFEDVAAAARNVDIPAVAAAVTRVLGPTGTARSRRAMLPQIAVARITEDVVGHLRRRHPDVDDLESELIIEFLTTGLLVIGRRWNRATGGRAGEAERALWARLVEELIDTMRRGYPLPTETT
jgi:TetR/AcrR family transcriptional regulator of autoinduction and epiphytic fitness